MSTPGVVAIARDKDARTRWRIHAPFKTMADNGYPAYVMWHDQPAEMPMPSDARIVVLSNVVADDLDSFLAMRDTFHKRDMCVVLDLDDDLLTYAWTEHQLAVAAQPKSFHELELERNAWLATAQSVDAITVSTQRLAELVRTVIRHVPVYVLPNALDVEWFRSGVNLGWRQDIGGPVSIGWAGERRPFRDVQPMLQAWRTIDRNFGDAVRFVWSGWQILELFRYVSPERVTLLSWQDGNAYADAMSVHIGCCPAEPTPFNLCKSPIKAWEYIAAGAKVVASAELYKPLLCPNQSIALAEHTVEDWELSIVTVMNRPRPTYDTSSFDLATKWHVWPDTYAEILGQWRLKQLVAVDASSNG